MAHHYNVIRYKRAFVYSSSTSYNSSNFDSRLRVWIKHPFWSHICHRTNVIFETVPLTVYLLLYLYHSPVYSQNAMFNIWFPVHPVGTDIPISWHSKRGHQLGYTLHIHVQAIYVMPPIMQPFISMEGRKKADFSWQTVSGCVRALSGGEEMGGWVKEALMARALWH